MNTKNNNLNPFNIWENNSCNLSPCTVILLFIYSLLSLFLVLKYNILLPYSYIYLSFFFYFLIFVSYKKDMVIIYPLIIVFYSVFIVSVFAFRFGLFHGDSQLDLNAVLYILKYNFIESVDSYNYSIFPILHIFTAFIGYLIGKSTLITIYDVAIWIPTISTIVSTLFIYLNVNLLTGKNKYGLLSSIVWISLPFVSRWMIQFTRATIAIPFLIMLSYLLIKQFENRKVTASYVILSLIIICVLILAHPVVSFFGVLSLLFVFIYELLRVYVGDKFPKHIEYSPYTKKIDTFMILSFVFLLFYWIYMAYMIAPFNNTISQFSMSFEHFLTKSIFGQILANKVSSSYSVASKNFKLFGLSRVILFFLISFIGLLILSLEKKFKSISIPLSAFGLIFMILNYLMGAVSTTFYRTAVYSSTWLILVVGYAMSKIENINSKKIKNLAYLIILILLVIPSPFFTGEVVLPSDWIFGEYPIEHIDYEAGEAQRFLEHYHTDVPIWISKYTHEKSLIWSDGAYTYASVIGYGDRNATYSPSPITEEGISISKFRNLNCDYVIVNALMRRTLYVPYGTPSFYSNYNFDELELNPNSYKIYDSKDANVYTFLFKEELK